MKRTDSGRNGLKIGGRLTLGYMVFIAFIVVVAAISYASLKTINGIAADFIQAKVPAVDALDQSDRDMQQLLVAERTILTATPGSADYKQQISDYNENLQQSLDRVNIFAKLASTADEKKYLDGYFAERQKWTALSGEVMKLAETGDPADLAKAREISLGPANDEFNKTRDFLNSLEDYELDYAKKLYAQANTTFNRTVALLVGPTVLAILLTLLVAFLLTRSITLPLRKAVSYAELIAEGDFRSKLTHRRNDEIGTLATALNDMATKLKGMLRQVRVAADHVAGSSEEIYSSSQQLSSNSQNQAATLEETSASVEELTASVEQVSDHAQSQAASVEESASNMDQMRSNVEQVSRTLTSVSSSSEESMSKAQSGMDAVTKTVDAIKSISKSSDQIAGIITVISDIAEQTNLLALNASIEAARAGEHGRGFAVVADEVSKLAERSSASTKEIEELIKDSSKNVSEGVEIARQALGSMEGIISGARKTNEMVATLVSDVTQQLHAIAEVAKATESISEMSQSISAATEEQTTNAKQVSKAVENANEITQAAAAAAEQMSASTQQLSEMARQLQRLVNQFKIDEDGAAAAENGTVAISDDGTTDSRHVAQKTTRAA